MEDNYVPLIYLATTAGALSAMEIISARGKTANTVSLIFALLALVLKTPYNFMALIFFEVSVLLECYLKNKDSKNDRQLLRSLQLWAVGIGLLLAGKLTESETMLSQALLIGALVIRAVALPFSLTPLLVFFLMSALVVTKSLVIMVEVQLAVASMAVLMALRGRQQTFLALAALGLIFISEPIGLFAAPLILLASGRYISITIGYYMAFLSISFIDTGLAQEVELGVAISGGLLLGWASARRKFELEMPKWNELVTLVVAVSLIGVAIYLSPPELVNYSGVIVAGVALLSEVLLRKVSALRGLKDLKSKWLPLHWLEKIFPVLRTYDRQLKIVTRDSHDEFIGTNVLRDGLVYNPALYAILAAATLWGTYIWFY